MSPLFTLIKGVQEGVVVAMADGYARLSGKVGVCSVANVGLPNGVTQLVNTYKDRIPLLLVVGAFPQEQVGRDGPQEYEHQENMLAPLTKWYWQAQSVAGIPETVRRALKFAATPPGGPVFLAIPDNMLRTEGTRRRDGQGTVRRADADSRRPEGHRGRRASADRGKEPAPVGRRRNHPVPGRE